MLPEHRVKCDEFEDVDRLQVELVAIHSMPSAKYSRRSPARGAAAEGCAPLGDGVMGDQFIGLRLEAGRQVAAG